MDEPTRRAIAFKALAQSSKSAPSSIFSYEESKHSPFSGDAKRFFDYEAGAHVSGDQGSMFHYGTGGHISFSMTGRTFSGFDYKSGSHFSGSISGRSVSIFDYGTGQYYNYSG